MTSDSLDTGLAHLRARYRGWKYQRAKRRMMRAREERIRLETKYPAGEAVPPQTFVYELARMVWMQTFRWVFP